MPRPRISPIHAALTGHLVLTTLHTETAPAAVPRLLDLGVEGFLLQSTLRGVIAQRLVRMLCDRCKRKRQLTLRDLRADPRYAALGFAAGETHPRSGRLRTLRAVPAIAAAAACLRSSR